MLEVMRAEAEWQRAGAYSVRIQGMNRQYHISLREEFDEHDCDGTKYIVLLEDGYPVGTCRFYPVDAETVMIGRVVVLEDYRGRGYGRLVITEAEAWISALGYRRIWVDSRDVAVGFYSRLGFVCADPTVFQSGPFACVRMEKTLK